MLFDDLTFRVRVYVLVTRIVASELAALFRVLCEVCTTLRPLAQCCHTHLCLAVVTRAAQTRVVTLGREVQTLADHVIADIHTCLPYAHKRK